MNGRCEWCGATDKPPARKYCVNVPACMARKVEQVESDRWYAAEVERMRERAPA